MRTIFLLFWSFTITANGLQVEIKASSAMLMNAASGTILYEKHGNAPAYPASTTKIGAALFILSEIQPNLDQKIKVSAESLKMRPTDPKKGFPPHWWYPDGTRMDLLEDEYVTVDALLHGLMMVSGNDAANVLAEGFYGSIPTFVQEMNAYLRKIGCSQTQFLNPHGCHHPEHFTTAYDLCLMTKEALKYQKFREIVSKVQYQKPRTNKQGPADILHTNPLIKPGRFFYPKAIGGKTGFHNHSQYTLVAAAEHEGRTLIAAVMGTPDSADRYADAILLFEAAFAEVKEQKRLFGPENLFSRQIPGAKTDLTASLKTDLILSYFPAEEPNARAFVYWDNSPLPIKKGSPVGAVRILSEKGDLLAQGELIAKEDVHRTFLFAIKDMIAKLF